MTQVVAMVILDGAWPQPRHPAAFPRASERADRSRPHRRYRCRAVEVRYAPMNTAAIVKADGGNR
jgi:hypothetical protein